jgi:hypothetical protein
VSNLNKIITDQMLQLVGELPAAGAAFVAAGERLLTPEQIFSAGCRCLGWPLIIGLIGPQDRHGDFDASADPFECRPKISLASFELAAQRVFVGQPGREPSW